MPSTHETIQDNPDASRRDWDWERDGDLDGMYVETRLVHVKNGPSAGQVKPVLDFHVGIEDELITVWPPAVLRRQFREELQLRNKLDFEPGERFQVSPKGKKDGPNGPYWDFADTLFEFAAPKPSAAAMLGAGEDSSEGEDSAESHAPADASGLNAPIETGDDDVPWK